MKKATPLLLALFTLFSISVKAQSNSTIAPTGTFHELGINGTFFFANFLSFNGTIPVSVDPYALQYKVLFGGRNGIRLGIGANYRMENDRPQNGTRTEFNTVATNSRLGYEHRLNFGRRWAAFFGVDLVHNFSRSRNKTVDDGFQTVTIETTNHGGGGGPVIGIQFHATPRISIGTETAIHYITDHEQAVTDIISDFGPPTNSSNSTSRANFNFNLPTSLYVNINFGGRN